MQAGSCRLRVAECGRRWCLGGSGGSPVVEHRPGVQWCNRRPLSSSWTGASGSLRWTPGNWRWGGPWVEEVVEVGNGVKVGGVV